MTQLTDPQTQAVLIRLCIIPRVTHLLRLMPDRIIRPLLEEFDAEIRLRFSEYSGASLDDDYARTRFHFPLRPGFGGFGQRSAMARRHAAYIAGTLSGLAGLATIDAAWRASVLQLAHHLGGPDVAGAAGAPGPAPGWLTAAVEAHAAFVAEVSEGVREELGLPPSLWEAIADAGAGMQRRYQHALDRERRTRFRDRLLDACDRAAAGAGREV